jgi:16S rRNA processing protein RimM
MKSSKERLHIATIGKCVGLRGDLKLHLHTDFPGQFAAGKTFTTDKNISLTIIHYDPIKSLIQFAGYQDRETAAKLTNQKLFTTMERTLDECKLEEGEHFWFEIIGRQVVEDGKVLGEVAEIERIVNTDYLVVKTDASLVEEGFSKRFYIPWIPQYIERTDKAEKVIYVKDALALLEAS